MDEAEDGVIYFSLGSLIEGGTMSEEQVQVFTSVFSELPQRIVWKTKRNFSLPNVKTSWWLPQFEILSKL
jgi:glucuronosyltransferase